MSNKDRHAHAGRRQLDARVENFFGLGQHFPFLFRVAVLHEDVDVRNAIEGNFPCELLGLVVSARHVLALGLIPKLIHRVFAGPRDGLVG